MRADEEGLSATQIDVGFLELRTAGAHGLDLPALERHARLVALLDEVVEARLAVLGDQPRRLRLFGHPLSLMGKCPDARDQALGAGGQAARGVVRAHQRYRELSAVPAMVHSCQGRVALAARDRGHPPHRPASAASSPTRRASGSISGASSLAPGRASLTGSAPRAPPPGRRSTYPGTAPRSASSASGALALTHARTGTESSCTGRCGAIRASSAASASRASAAAAEVRCAAALLRCPGASRPAVPDPAPEERCWARCRARNASPCHP